MAGRQSARHPQPVILRPHQCPWCLRGYSNSYALAKHVYTQHAAMSFGVAYCPSGCGYQIGARPYLLPEEPRRRDRRTARRIHEFDLHLRMHGGLHVHLMSVALGAAEEAR